MAATVPAVSKEYLHGPVTADVDLDTQTIEVAFLPKLQVSPDDTTSWLAAEWDGAVGKTRSWRILIGPGTTAALPPEAYLVWLRLTDVTEAPIRKHDLLTII